MFSVLISAFPSLLLPNFQAKASAPESPSDTPCSGGARIVLPQHLAQAQAQAAELQQCVDAAAAGSLSQSRQTEGHKGTD